MTVTSERQKKHRFQQIKKKTFFYWEDVSLKIQ